MSIWDLTAHATSAGTDDAYRAQVLKLQPAPPPNVNAGNGALGAADGSDASRQQWWQWFTSNGGGAAPPNQNP